MQTANKTLKLSL